MAKRSIKGKSWKPLPWKPTFVIAAKPFVLDPDKRDALLKILGRHRHLDEPFKSEFLREFEFAIAHYLVACDEFSRVTPAKVRQRIEYIQKNADLLTRRLRDLPLTALWLFPDRSVGALAKSILDNADQALTKAKRWPNARLPDYAKRGLVFWVAHALRDVASLRLSASKKGILWRCVELALSAAGNYQADRTDFSKTLKSVLLKLQNVPKFRPFHPDADSKNRRIPEFSL
jgi:hypothetical protein